MDFFQQGPTTLHRLHADDSGVRPLVRRVAQGRQACVVLPMLYSEMQRPSIRGIRDGLATTDYLNELIIPLTAEDEGQVEEVRKFFDPLPYPVRVLWCEGPPVREVIDTLADRGLDITGYAGKGLAVWLGMGAASEENAALAIHDADIEDYDPLIVDRLLFPILSEELDFFFAKGYYARLTENRLYGRVVRLFVWPFLDALQTVLPHPSPFVAHLRSYRYPLSGEMAMTADLARNLRMPTDWGLELGLLGEVFRNTSAKRVCQVDLGLYSHKHKKVGRTVSEGLQKMVMEIAAAIFRLLAATEGYHITPEMVTSLRVAYRREGQDAIRRYHADSIINRLEYDRHGEEVVVERFESLVQDAGRLFLDAPLTDQISEWLRALSADPEAPRRPRRTALTGAEAQRLREAARQA